MKNLRIATAGIFLVSLSLLRSAPDKAEKPFTKTFGVEEAELSSSGTNRFFVLEPGFQLVLEGTDHGKPVLLTITVLKETKRIGDVETRVVEEREVVNGEVAEVSRNFFAISRRTNDVFYFGEDVDIYRHGKLVGHEGGWVTGMNGARYGLAMPGTPLLGARYQQELAPDVAMDRAEVISLDEKFETPAGKFEGCLKTKESTPIEDDTEYKLYAPGIGLIQDEDLKLTKVVRP